MKVRIFKPAKSAMQSGKARTKKWCMKPIEEKKLRHINDLMHWVSIDSTMSELNFEFASKEEAVDFAKKSGFEFVVEESHAPRLQKKAYADNFL